ncbi:hypothetical protein O181_118341 [Austropuccinia psidii MF-1]|uniref:Uncharacterized protein n=1 Tax=Austropuccinia psidii MF-1 TaxID=1389203 RepID=A0A9Q3KDQ4_9BASI|nr:hypothetical protein [Austropuccinia psidii MF-1]
MRRQDFYWSRPAAWKPSAPYLCDGIGYHTDQSVELSGGVLQGRLAQLGPLAKSASPACVAGVMWVPRSLPSCASTGKKQNSSYGDISPSARVTKLTLSSLCWSFSRSVSVPSVGALFLGSACSHPSWRK